jgi:anti-anti-sigma regulatory factor
MKKTLTWKIETRGAETHVVLTGAISEYAPLDPLLSELAGPSNPSTVTIDLAGVSSINSIGVRNWLELMRALETRGVALVLERCSVPIVHQLSMIAGFEGVGTVRSVFAPYYCAACNRAEDRLLSLEGEGVAERLLEPGACPACGGPQEFDDLPEHYVGLAAALGQN